MFSPVGMKKFSPTYSSCSVKAASVYTTRKCHNMWCEEPHGSFALLRYISYTCKEGETGYVQLHENQDTKLMADHVPISLYFSKIAYSLSSTTTFILSNVSRNVKPCQMVAIMGTLSASTTRKSTLLDILWWTRRRRKVSGTVLVNGLEMDDEIFKKVVGYVDLEDAPISTLTVYETVLYSALLRLSRSREINDEARKLRMLEMLAELGFFGYQGCVLGMVDTPPFLARNHKHTIVSLANCVALKERKCGVKLDVPALTIHSMSSLRDQLCWWLDITLTCILFVTFATASLKTMSIYVKEERYDTRLGRVLDLILSGWIHVTAGFNHASIFMLGCMDCGQPRFSMFQPLDDLPTSSQPEAKSPST
ncbi:hypothetical protein BDN70DRAFT_925817 [Pholiota conissans]|uniref:Uncharacterized protein n=1 Tax=Pholiota conissans TaxID=109636 RepID=A0A9P5YLS4_9AGAR|nr:hypothetical protein BDN70DRAFT_925817 [Pholiota conissans]